MTHRCVCWFCSILLLSAGLFGVAQVVAAPPAAPPLAATISVDDLVAQVKASTEEIERWLDSEASYNEHKDHVKDEANILTIVALVLAKHEQNHELQKTAPALIAPAQQLAKAKNFSEAQKSLVNLKEALGGQGDVKAPEWSRIAGLGSTMRRVAATHTKLRNSLKRLDPRRAADNARAATVLAAVGQAIIYDTHEVKDPADLPKWYTMSAEMRDACGELSKAIRAGDKGAATAAAERVQKNCDDCHAVFQP
ncbi:MAG: cytochrome c [Planctomycetes bacterium]|nr:cytochrome c [Planctomycetota bacterium]